MEGEEILSAEEFFGESQHEFPVGRRAIVSGREKRGDKLFEETKIRMVMKIHKLSRSRARKMIKEIQERCARTPGKRDEEEHATI